MSERVVHTQNEQDIATALKSWVMVVLTLIFVLLYGAALFGWMKPLTDSTMVARLEPIIFVIIGYYFGRLPSQQNEKTLKDEIIRQTQKADAAQHVKEQLQQTREGLEEKIKNARIALTTVSPGPLSKESSNNTSNAPVAEKESALHYTATTVLHILNS